MSAQRRWARFHQDIVVYPGSVNDELDGAMLDPREDNSMASSLSTPQVRRSAVRVQRLHISWFQSQCSKADGFVRFCIT